MGLDLWFQTDVARILKSKADAAIDQAGGDYLRGYLAALRHLAVEFGVPDPAAGTGQWRPARPLELAMGD